MCKPFDGPFKVPVTIPSKSPTTLPVKSPVIVTAEKCPEESLETILDLSATDGRPDDGAKLLRNDELIPARSSSTSSSLERTAAPVKSEV